MVWSVVIKLAIPAQTKRWSKKRELPTSNDKRSTFAAISFFDYVIKYSHEKSPHLSFLCCFVFRCNLLWNHYFCFRAICWNKCSPMATNLHQKIQLRSSQPPASTQNWRINNREKAMIYCGLKPWTIKTDWPPFALLKMAVPYCLPATIPRCLAWMTRVIRSYFRWKRRLKTKIRWLKVLLRGNFTIERREWSWGDSNPWPSECHSDALPTAPQPRDNGLRL